jgi:hypothetical protein
VQQLVEPTRRTTAWTAKTGQRQKWTTREESRLARLEQKEKYTGDGDGQPNQEYAEASIDYLVNNHELETITRSSRGEPGRVVGEKPCLQESDNSIDDQVVVLKTNASGGQFYGVRVASAARHRFGFPHDLTQPKRRRRFALPAHSKVSW